MKRDMNKIIEQVKETIPKGYLLTVDEWIQLSEKAKKDGNFLLFAIRDAFFYGFALGTRYQKSKKKAPAKKQGRA